MKTLAAPLALLFLAAGCGAPDAPRACCAAKAEAGKADACCADQAPSACCAAGDRQQTVSRQFLKPGDRRTFAVEYVGKVSDVPAGTKKLRVWIPVPQDTTVQAIRDLSFSREPRLATEPKYGNRIASWEIENPPASLDLAMRFVCARDEIRTDLALLKADGDDAPGAFSVFKAADALVVVDDEIRALSETVVRGKSGTLEKARAIYDYVVNQMKYDKSHAGWGRGSTKHACQVGKGNCTDFHALFNSLCRAQGIASGFEIGLYLPYDRPKQAEQLGGYHCWAFFRVPGKTWVPVDCSEASRFGDKREYFFGGHTSNRVTFTTGRDLVLEPRQDGEPLNYFLNPYAEADGKPVTTDKVWSFKDLE
jgi:transglutaminase-like putative cysteine protease